MDELNIEIKSEWSSKDNKPNPLQSFLAALFMPVSMLLTVVGSLVMKLGNVLMFDTHHLSIEIIPKK